MQRFAFKMKLKPGFAAEYERRHNAIWPALSLLLKEKGISDYTIFLDEARNELFAVQKQNGQSSQDLGAIKIIKKWWDYMSDIMETNSDKSPITIPLKEVFHLD